MPDGSPPARRRPPGPPPEGEGAPRRSETRQVPRTAPPAGARPPRPGAGAPGPGPARRAPSRSAVPAAAPKLYFNAGPREGEQVVLSEPEMVVGRATDVAISVADTSVSRRHLSLRRGDEGWLVKDLGSGNGTLLNGDPITEEMPLRHADVVTIGETEFTFSDDSNVTGKVAAPPARPRPSGEFSERRPGQRPTVVRQRPEESAAARKKRKLVMIAATLVLLILVGGAGKMRLDQMRIEAAQLEEQRAMEKAAAELDSQMQEARNLIRQGQWKEARALLGELEAAAPGQQNVADLIARADVEIPNQEQLAVAKEALAKGEIARAQKALSSVTADTAMFELASQVKRGIEDEAHSRLVRANDLLRDSKFEEALAIAEDVLGAFPDDRDAQLMVEQSKEGIEKGRVTPRANPNPRSRRDPTDPAVAKFLDGDLTGAAALLNTCADQRACKEMLRDVSEFGRLYKQLDTLSEKGLSRILSLDRQITGGRQSKLAGIAGTKAAGIYLRAAQSYKASGRWDRVGQYLDKALQANPSLVAAKKLKNELNDRAQQTYMSAYSLKDTDAETAIEKFREVVQMTSPSDEWHGKAKNWLSKLGR